jgi:hypothetical protein
MSKGTANRQSDNKPAHATAKNIHIAVKKMIRESGAPKNRQLFAENFLASTHRPPEEIAIFLFGEGRGNMWAKWNPANQRSGKPFEDSKPEPDGQAAEYIHVMEPAPQPGPDAQAEALKQEITDEDIDNFFGFSDRDSGSGAQALQEDALREKNPILTLVEKVKQRARQERRALAGKDSEYSTELSLKNLPNLANKPLEASPDAEAPAAPGQPPFYAEMKTTEVTEEELGIGQEDLEKLEIGSGPPPRTDASSETSTTISEAIIQETARRNGKSEPPAEKDEESGRAAVLPGSLPETGTMQYPEPEFLEGKPSPKPAGVMRENGHRDTMSEVFGAVSKEERTSLLMEAAQGVSSDTVEKGTVSMHGFKLREHSLVEAKVQNMMPSVPNRFHSTVEDAMEILREGLIGFEPLVEKFMKERRWTREEESALQGAYGKTTDHLQSLFDRKYDLDANIRIERRKVSQGKLSDTEKEFSFAVLKSCDPHSNRETNVFDAFAKGAMFLYLIKQRPGSFIHAIGHPEISKPYGQLGGAEGAGISTGLSLYPQNIQLAFLFRCYEETHLLTISNELRDAVIQNPTRPLAGKFENMVRQDVAEFETAVSDTGMPPEKFFEILNAFHTTDTIRSSKELERIFKKARSEGLIYTKTNDVFDALELINDHMVALRMNPVARDFFMKFYLANYPLGEHSGKFYKMFGMCLFDSIEDINKNPIARKAFEEDPNPTVRKCFAKRLETLEFEERKTIISDPEDPNSGSDGEIDFSGV